MSTSTAPFLRHPSSDRQGTQLQHEDAQALISAVLNLSQARGLVVGSPPPPYFPPIPRPAVRYARLALGAALLLAFGGISYWMGSSFHKPSGETPEAPSTVGAAAAAAAPAAHSVDPALIQAVMQALAQQSAAAPAKTEPAKSAPPQKPLAKQATTPRPVASVKVAATPGPLVAQPAPAPAPKPGHRTQTAAPSPTPAPPRPLGPRRARAPAPKPVHRTQTAAPSPTRAPQQTAGSKPAAGAPATIAGVPTFATTAPTPASDDSPARQRDDGNGVSVDLGAVGSATATPQRPAARRSSSTPATSIHASAPAAPPAPAEPAQAPTPRIAAADFSVVGVLDGMVLVQQGRRVSPVAIGQTLPDGKVLRSTDAESGMFEAGRL